MVSLNVETKVFSYTMCMCISIAFFKGFHHAINKPKLRSTSLLYESACALFIKQSVIFHFMKVKVKPLKIFSLVIKDSGSVVLL